MNVRWTTEAIDFVESLERYSPGLGVRVLQETECKLVRFAGIHIQVPILTVEGSVRSVYRMLLSTRLPYKVYYALTTESVVQVVAIRDARQRPVEVRPVP